MLANDVAFQRRVASIVLHALENDGFALAGSGALREHGVISRPTEDIDIFGSSEKYYRDPDGFSRAVENSVCVLRGNGMHVEERIRTESFCRLDVDNDEHTIQVDLGLDHRDRPVIVTDIGSIVSLDDAVASKVDAVYGRGEPRDYLDLYSIRQNAVFTDEELLAKATELDAGFDPSLFVALLDDVNMISIEEVAAYGIDENRLEAIKESLILWSHDIKRTLDEDIRHEGTPELDNEAGPHLNEIAKDAQKTCLILRSMSSMDHGPYSKDDRDKN